MSNKDAATFTTAGVAACAACCAGPVVGFIAAAGAAAALGFAALGLVGLLLGVAVFVVLRRRHRRRIGRVVLSSRCYGSPPGAPQ